MSHTYNLPLIRTDTRSTVSTDATAPNLPGPGRNLGLLLDRVGKRVETILNKCANRIGMGPVHVAKEIRLLSGHNEMTIYERYSTTPRQLSAKETKALKRRCNKLLKFSGSRLLSTQLAAFNQVTELAIEDSLIRAIFAECRLEYLEPKFLEPNLLLTSAKALASIKEAETHRLWSTIVRLPDDGSIFQYERMIEVSFRESDTSFIATRHLSNASRYLANTSFVLIMVLFKVAGENWLNMDWPNISNGVCEYIRADPNRRRSVLDSTCYFYLRSNEENHFVRERHAFAKLFPLLCPIPRVAAERNTFDSQITIKEVADWNLDDCASFCVIFLTALSGSEDIYDQLLFLESIDTATRRLLEGTALLDELCIAYCHLRHSSGVECIIGYPFIKISNPHSSPRGIKTLARGLCDTGSPSRRSLAGILASSFCSLNRYCKSDFESFLFSGGLWAQVNQIRERNTDFYLAHLTGLRIPFLFRLIVDGVCLFVTGNLEKDMKTIKQIFWGYSAQNISVDVLLGHRNNIMEIKVGEADSFDATGHFPILAGYDESGRALFCARGEHWHLVPWYRITGTVLDGSSSVILTNKIGKIRTIQTFYVLGLRFDPSDIREDIASNVEGAMDPTGPSHWLRLWPSEDPSLSYIMGEFDYNRMKEELIPFLDECARSTSYRADKQEDLGVMTDVCREDNGNNWTAEFPLGQRGYIYQQVGTSEISEHGVESNGEDYDAFHEGGEVEEHKLLDGIGNMDESSIPDISSGAFDDPGVSSNCTREGRLGHGPNAEMSEERDNEESIEYWKVKSRRLEEENAKLKEKLSEMR